MKRPMLGLTLALCVLLLVADAGRTSAQPTAASSAIMLRLPDMTEKEQIPLAGLVQAEAGVRAYAIFVNGEKVVERELVPRRTLDLEKLGETVKLREGENVIELRFLDTTGSWIAEQKKIVQRPTPPHAWALFVGVSRYASTSVPTCVFCQRDADELAEKFRKYAQKRFGPDRSHIYVMLNEGATRLSIENSLNDIRSRAGRRDLVVFYFAGRGTTIVNETAWTLNSYLLPYEADRRRPLTTGLSFSLLREYVTTMRGQVYVVLDTSLSGKAEDRSVDFFDTDEARRFARHQMAYAGWLDRLVAGGKVAVLVSSRGDEGSYESHEHRHGWFTYHLLEFLERTLATNREVDLFEGLQYVSAGLQDTGKHGRFRQQPILRISRLGDESSSPAEGARAGPNPGPQINIAIPTLVDSDGDGNWDAVRLDGVDLRLKAVIWDDYALRNVSVTVDGILVWKKVAEAGRALDNPYRLTVEGLPLRAGPSAIMISAINDRRQVTSERFLVQVSPGASQVSLDSREYEKARGTPEEMMRMWKGGRGLRQFVSLIDQVATLLHEAAASGRREDSDAYRDFYRFYQQILKSSSAMESNPTAAHSKELMAGIEALLEQGPSITIAEEKALESLSTQEETVVINGRVTGRWITRYAISVNGIPVVNKLVTERTATIRYAVPLNPGENRIVIEAENSFLIRSRKIFAVHHVEEQETWGLVIGIGEYRRLSSLRYGRPDAEGMFKFLTNHSNLLRDRIKLLVDQNASKTNIQQAIDWLRKIPAPKNASIWLYYSGYGAARVLDVQDKRYERYLLPYDTDPNDRFSTGISLDDMLERIQREIQPRELLVILDTSFDGAPGQTPEGEWSKTWKLRGEPPVITREEWVPKTDVGFNELHLSSSSPDQASLEPRDSRRYARIANSFFTHFLTTYLLDLNGDGVIDKKDRDIKTKVDISSLYSQILADMGRTVGWRQIPFIRGGFTRKFYLETFSSGDFVNKARSLLIKGKSRLVMLSEAPPQKIELASMYADKALELNSENHEGYNALGALKMSLAWRHTQDEKYKDAADSYDQAEQAFKRALSLISDDERAQRKRLRYNLGLLYSAQRKLAMAEVELRESLRIPDKSEPDLERQSLLQLGYVLLYQGKPATARVFLLRVDPLSRRAREAIGQTHLLEGNLEQALARLTEASQDEEATMDTFFELGMTHYYRGNYREALMSFGEGLRPGEESDDYVALWRHLVLKRLGEYQEADATLRQQERGIRPGSWSGDLIKFYLGKITERELVKAIESAKVPVSVKRERECEAFFYIGSQKALKRQTKAAAEYFTRAKKTQTVWIFEYTAATLELRGVR